MRAILLNKGDRYGKLKIIRPFRVGKIKKWACRCKCGKITYQKAGDLVSGTVVSCGCKRTEVLLSINTTHGLSKIPEHKVWENMIVRCTNRNTPYWKHYGGRGIKVCERWLSSFPHFLEDVGRRPSSLHELDRYPNNDGNYEPGNCRWATRRQQLNNRRGTVRLTIKGETKTITEWSEISGINLKTIVCRLKVGRSAEDAVFTPVHRKIHN